MKLLWLLLLVPIIYLGFKLLDSPVSHKSVIGEVIELKEHLAIVETNNGSIESIPNSNYSVGQKVEVDVLKTRFTNKPIYRTTSTLEINIKTLGD